MSKVIGKFEFEDVTKDFVSDYKYGWLHLLPTIEYRHKYWYMWEFEFIFLKWCKKIQITRTDWDKYQDRDEKLFWKRMKKITKMKNGNKTKIN